MNSPFTMTATEEPGTGLAVPGMPRVRDPVEVFKPGGATKYIQEVRLFVASQNLDVSSDPGRDFVRSFAYQLVRTRTTGLDEADKLIADDKKHIAEVNSEKKFFETEMKKIWNEVRGPLTEFENRDKERVGAHEMVLGQIFDACLFLGAPTIQGIKDRMAALAGFESRKWEEFQARATSALAQSRPALQAMLEKAEKAEADRIELEENRRKLRELEAAEADRKQKEREEQIRKDATERAEKASQQRLEEAQKPKKLWVPEPFERATAPMAPKPIEVATPLQSISGWPVPKPEPQGEAIPPRADEHIEVATGRDRIEYEIGFDLGLIVDYDQATDILAAIKAGKIRHVQIVY